MEQLSGVTIMIRLFAFILCLAFAGPASAGDYAKLFPLQLKSRYFDFRYQRNAWDAPAFAKFADNFVDLVNRDFIKVDFNYPIQVLVLPDRAAFQKFLRTEFKVDKPPNWGIYLSQLRLFATYEGSGYGTFAHEIMHPLVDRNLPGRPWWAVEAIPSFFEKFFGYYENNTMVVQWGYQNPWRIDALGPRLASVDLESLVKDSSLWEEADTSVLRLITVFVWQQGKLPRLLRLIADRNHDGFPTYFEAALAMPLQDILPLWRKYLDEIQAHRTEIMQIPASEIFDDKASFSQFMAMRRLPIRSEL